MRATGWLWIDPVLSIGIGVLIVWSAWDVIKESLDVLLEGLPRGIRFADVSAKLREVEGVVDVHDLHIWTLGAHAHALSCHVQIDDMPTSASESILTKLNQVLDQQFPQEQARTGICVVDGHRALEHLDGVERHPPERRPTVQIAPAHGLRA